MQLLQINQFKTQRLVWCVDGPGLASNVFVMILDLKVLHDLFKLNFYNDPIMFNRRIP